jgi:hypothetical protein
MNTRQHQCCVIQLPEFAHVVDFLLRETMPNSPDARALLAGATWAIVTLSPENYARAFRPSNLAEVQTLLRVLHAEALPGRLGVSLACSATNAEALTAFCQTLPLDVSGRLQ